MSKFRNFVAQMKSGASDFKQKVMKFKNKSFLDKAMGGCAWVSLADGSVTSDEKQKMMKHIEHDDAMSVFDTKEVIEAYKTWIDLFEFDVDVARNKLLKELGALKSKEEEARSLVRIFISIGAADGDFDDQEKDVVRTMCLEMGLSPSDFQL